MSDDMYLRQRLCYEQNFITARSLNEQLNRIPALSITLTGGLWFGAAITHELDEIIRFALLLFSGICNFTLILALFRVRDVLESYLQKIREFDINSYANGRPSSPKLGWFGGYGLITLYAVLMFFSGSISIVGSFFFYWPFCGFSNVLSFVLLMVVLLSIFLYLNYINTER